MKILIALTIGFLVLVGCLPDVSTETSEVEARIILTAQLRTMCRDKLSASSWQYVLNTVHEATVEPTRDYWLFKVTHAPSIGPLEAQVFPSKLVGGDYIDFIDTQVCK